MHAAGSFSTPNPTAVRPSLQAAERALSESPLNICGIPIKNLTMVEDRDAYYRTKHANTRAALLQVHTFWPLRAGLLLLVAVVEIPAARLLYCLIGLCCLGFGFPTAALHALPSAALTSLFPSSSPSFAHAYTLSAPPCCRHCRALATAPTASWALTS